MKKEYLDEKYELERYSSACELINKLKSAEQLAENEGWIDADDVEIESEDYWDE